jgi:hypothetical protein
LGTRKPKLNRCGRDLRLRTPRRVWELPMKVCWRATAFAGLCASCSPTPASRAHFRDALFLDIGYAWMHQLFVGLMLAGEQTPERPFVTVGRIRQEAAGHTDCCSRVARLQGFLPLRETGRWLVSFGKRRRLPRSSTTRVSHSENEYPRRCEIMKVRGACAKRAVGVRRVLHSRGLLQPYDAACAPSTSFL